MAPPPMMRLRACMSRRLSSSTFSESYTCSGTMATKSKGVSLSRMARGCPEGSTQTSCRLRSMLRTTIIFPAM